MHNSIDLWTRPSGWIVADGDAPHGYSVTRRTLDPILRELAAETPGVELMSGWTAVGLLGERTPSGRAHRGSRARDARRAGGAGRRRRRPRLEGRSWARVPGRVKPQRRFFYWGYWRGLRPATERSRMWLLDPDAAYTFPNEDDLTVVLLAPHRDRLRSSRPTCTAPIGAASTRCPTARA